MWENLKGVKKNAYGFFSSIRFPLWKSWRNIIGKSIIRKRSQIHIYRNMIPMNWSISTVVWRKKNIC